MAGKERWVRRELLRGESDKCRWGRKARGGKGEGGNRWAGKERRERNGRKRTAGKERRERGRREREGVPLTPFLTFCNCTAVNFLTKVHLKQK